MSPKTLVWFIRFRKRQLKKSGPTYERKTVEQPWLRKLSFLSISLVFRTTNSSQSAELRDQEGTKDSSRSESNDHSKTFKLIMCPVWTEREHLCLCQSIISHLVLKEKLKITEKKKKQHQGSGQLFKHRLDVVLHHWRKSKKDSSKTSLYSSFFLNRNLASRRNSFCIECRSELNSKAGDKHTRG